MPEGQDNKLVTKIWDAVDNLVTLRIITAVGQPKMEKGKPEVDFDRAKVISTKISLLDGDITTVFDPEFVTGGYQCLREYHAAREKEGHQIVQSNIKAVEALLQLAGLKPKQEVEK
jgi:hypothetical protein